ncbi:hypothetical protein EXIGLDRAFT_762385 [Exidia glandulosa HHB12029]|uniref:F-box domain-containing protein n=1 Tax=Exidia glandulosa HHB12029 TaxID=1314781 RepID=A0A165MTH3_EXIGL|nr:hypothetical protein EXIGLDRAFT_762385 [Exidia glandulosa HHB12029]
MSGGLRSAYTSTTIDSLPDELLLSIGRRAQLGPLRICAVCARWRRIGLDNKLLWTRIFLEDDRADWSVNRAEYFVARAGVLPLTIQRVGTDADAIRIDNFVLALLPRCRSFMYRDIALADASRPAFVRLLLQSQSSTLEGLCLDTVRGMEVAFHNAEALPVIANQFPSLCQLTVSNVCLPLSHMMAASRCIALLVNNSDHDLCQHEKAFGLEVDRLVSALPTLRVFRVFYQLGEYHERNSFTDPRDHFHMHNALVTLRSTIEELGLLAVPTIWPSPRQLEVISLLSTYAISPLLQLLAAAPNLVYLNIQAWYWPPIAAVPADFQVRDLPRLESVYFWELHEVFIQQIFSAFRTPRLRNLQLLGIYRDEETAFSLDEVFRGWNLPYLETFVLSSSPHDYQGDHTYPSLALGRMLRGGNLPRLHGLSIPTTGWGWVTAADLRDAVDALRDPAVAPSLVAAQLAQSDPPLDPDWIREAMHERNAQLGVKRRLRLAVLVKDNAADAVQEDGDE